MGKNSWSRLSYIINACIWHMNNKDTMVTRDMLWKLITDKRVEETDPEPLIPCKDPIVQDMINDFMEIKIRYCY